MVINNIQSDGDRVVVEAVVATPMAQCPGCGTASERVHSRYRRRLADAAVAGRTMVLSLVVRRFFCGHTECAARTFAEQVDGLTTKRSRRTNQLTSMLTSIGLALAGRAGARLARRLGLSASRDTLLRLVRGMPDPPVGAVKVLGVDDFAVRRGRRYGTVLLDMATHRPIDVLDDREADTLAAWLSAHPGIEIITRDRAGAYVEGARRGAPQAIQCADRWHIWQNLGQAVEKTVIAHRDCVRESFTATTRSRRQTAQSDNADAADSMAKVDISGVRDRFVQLRARTIERYDAVQRLRGQGMGLRTIAKELGIDRKTARRFAAASDPEDVIAAATSRAALLDDFVPHLLTSWNAGCTDVAVLTQELRQLGYRGSQRTVYRYLQPYRAGRKKTRIAAVPAAPKIRAVTAWIMRDPDTLAGDDAHQLAGILAGCPELEATRHHVGAFAVMMRDLRGNRLPEWMAQVRADNLPALHSFVTGLEHDFAAVTAGLTLPWSNGPVEGTVNKLKHHKRQCFGRAKLDLLRKRLLLSHATVDQHPPMK
ncbi:ISL3 family transposase [Nocardia sp. CA-084685]|uniref:ISL3 family transposase n=1 Tax=Nocardia sp. CA-084685 TaxID=3239970 RepID=UPI003D964990